MQAIEITADGVLALCQRPVPVIKNGEVLIRVMAAGVNRPDLLQRQGKYPPPPGVTDIPGLEVAGEIVGTGERVCALLPGGGYAEYAVAERSLCLPVPDTISMVEAAALPECVFTVWNNIFIRGQFKAGETVLIHGGASGIGTTAIQMCKAMGARVIVTAGSDEKCAACVALGADQAINYKSADFSNLSDIDIILDMVGGDYVPKNLKILREGGRHVSIASLNGSKAEIDIRTIMQKRLTLTGSTLRPRPVAEKAALAQGILEHIWPLVRSGKIRPVIHTVLPLDQAQAAHDLLESRNITGKIVLNINQVGR
jgi:NADPH2:quinone reductase